MKTGQTDVRKVLDILVDGRLYIDLSIRERLILLRHMMRPRKR